MKRILAISDIHGCYDELIELLQVANYNPADDQLVLVGDYIDRGKKNKQVIDYIINLVKHYDVIALRGNHDQMFLDYLNNPGNWLNVHNFLMNGGDETVRNYIDNFDEYQWHDETYREWAESIKDEHSEHVEFLDNLPRYLEYNDHEYVFVHAGINPHLNDWRFTDINDYIWIREQFLNNDHNHETTFVHGHTPARYLHKKDDIYFGNKKIGIDGACAYGGQLNCLEIKDGEYKQYSVKKGDN